MCIISVFIFQFAAAVVVLVVVVVVVTFAGSHADLLMASSCVPAHEEGERVKKPPKGQIAFAVAVISCLSPSPTVFFLLLSSSPLESLHLQLFSLFQGTQLPRVGRSILVSTCTNSRSTPSKKCVSLRHRTHIGRLRQGYSGVTKVLPVLLVLCNLVYL